MVRWFDVLKFILRLLSPLPHDKRGWRWFFGIMGLMAVSVIAIMIFGSFQQI